MQFIIALFLGIYIFGRMIYESEQKEKTARETKAHISHCESQVKLLAPSLQECWDMNDMIDSGDCAEDIYNKLHNELTAVFGDNYRKEFPIAGSKFYNPREHSENDCWAKDLLFSQKGLCDRIWLTFSFGYGRRALIDKKLCQQIEHNLRKYSKLPHITFVQEPRRNWSNGEYDWSIFGSHVIPEDMVVSGTPTRRLW